MGQMAGGNHTQVITGSQKYSTAGKKGNNSIDLGSKAATQNITHQVMASKHGGQFGNSTQYVSRAYTQSPGSVGGQTNKMNTIQVPHSSQGGQGNGMNLNISELYKQYAQKSFIGGDGQGPTVVSGSG